MLKMQRESHEKVQRGKGNPRGYQLAVHWEGNAEARRQLQLRGAGKGQNYRRHSRA